MAISLGNRAKMSTSTTGTGTITLGSASTGYQTFANAGITNGQTVRYAIEDGSNFEIGSGTYTASGTTLTRSVTESSNSDNAISLSGTANVFVTATVADIFINDGASALTTTGLITSGTLDVNGASQFDGAVSVGVDDTGHDVKFFGDAASAYMLWDASADDLKLVGAAGLTVAGDIDIDGTSNLDVVDIDGAVDMASTLLVTGVLTTTATQVATGGITSGSNIVSDTDSTDDLGTTGVRWANLFVDAITATDQITATGFTGTLDGILGSGAAAAATVTTLDTSGAVNLNLVTDSTSSTSGALIIDGGVGIAKKLFVGTDLDVDGTTNLDAVDIDGAVNMATTALVTGVLTTTAATVFNGGFASNADSLVGTDKKIKFRDAAIYINSSADGQLDIVADTEIQIAATTIDINGAINASGEIIAASLDISGNADIDGTLETDGLTVGGVAAKVAGKESIWIPAAAMYPSTTNPCSDLTQVETTALRPDLKVLDFAAAADDFAQFAIAFPKSWNEGTVTYQPFWTVTGTNTGTVVWQLGGIAVSSDDTINTAFGTLIATTALAHSGTSNDLMVSAESGAVTIAGSPAANDLCFFQINNDASASGQTGAVRLLGVKLFFTTDAANDA
jgi:hypothetical protein